MGPELIRLVFGYYLGLVTGSVPTTRLSMAVAASAVVAYALSKDPYHLLIYLGWLTGYLRYQVQRLFLPLLHEAPARTGESRNGDA